MRTDVPPPRVSSVFATENLSVRNGLLQQFGNPFMMLRPGYRTKVRETFHAASPPAAPKPDKSGIRLPDRGYGVKDPNRMVSVGNRSKIG